MSRLDQIPGCWRKWTLMVSLAFISISAPCCVAAAHFTFQPSAVVAEDLQPYAGSWHWMFQGKPFVTMHLVPTGDHFTGYMTNGFFTSDDAGNMTDAGSHAGQSPVTRSFFSGRVLHIVVQDHRDKTVSEWTMKLLDSKKAEFGCVDRDTPTNLKPWIAERASE